MKWIVGSYELLTIIRFAGECLCPDHAEDNGQFFFFFLVPYFVMFAKLAIIQKFY
jgi:hypothetical protein